MTCPATPPPLPVSQDEKTLAIVMHVLCLVGLPIIGPLIVWLVKKDESPYLDAQGRELLNFQISYAIYFFVAFLLVFVLVGFVILPALCLAGLVLVIIGLVRAAEGRVFRFPCIIRFL